MTTVRSKSFDDAQFPAGKLTRADEKALADGAWILTDGTAGTEAQCIAVAEGVGLPYRVRRVHPRGALQLLPVRLQLAVPPHLRLRLTQASEPLTPPWPWLILSSGRRSVPTALAVKSLSSAFAAHIQNPKVPPRLFDLIAAPIHDEVSGPNVIATMGSMHRVSPERVAEEAARFEAQFAALPHPRIAVLLGGTSGAFTFGASEAEALGATLARLIKETGGSLLVTPSRRTDRDAIAAFSKAIKGLPHFLWDGSGENPYLAMLGSADAIVVTEDSVNMVTEAAGTGKPVYVQSLPGKSRRLGRFHATMRERGATRSFEGRIETWSYHPINDTELVVSAIRHALQLETTA